MASLKYIGNAERMTVTLGSSYTAGSGTMTLTSGHGSRLPSSGDFWLVPTTGIYQAFKVTARSSDTLTVVGSQDGTTDASLSTGQELEWNLTASALTQLKTDASGGGLVPPPVASLWTGNANIGTSTITDVGSTLAMVFQGGGSILRSYERTVPSSAFKYTVKMNGFGGSTFLRLGMSVRSGSKLVGYGAREDGTPVSIDTWTTPSSWGGGPLSLGRNKIVGPVPEWYQIEVDATNVYYRLSPDGVTWGTVYQHTIASWLAGAPTHYGFTSYCTGSLDLPLVCRSLSIL